ncbi:hypothetical protein Q1695_002185 [Nippostrongylus brasiliensis]|nr:hypothetical protein Q1695_002185 [Nippostrongylus brasiliensis]
MQTKKLAIAILCLLFVDFAAGLSAKARESLTRANPGIDLEARRERLKHIGELIAAKIAKNATVQGATVENSPSVTLEISNSSTSDPSEPGIEEINAREGVADYLFNGDINLSEEQLMEIEDSLANRTSSRRKRQMSTAYAKWTNKHLYYSFDSSVSGRMKSIVRTSLAYLKARTCIDFTENAAAANRVQVFTGSGCWSAIGMQGGVQDLSLGNGCDVIGLATHEFMHALGAWHMHMRYDRDKYLIVDTTNVAPGVVGNFEKVTDIESVNYTPYEYGSDMHYAANLFTSSGYSLIPKTIGRYLQTEGTRFVSFYDVKMLNYHYRCHGVCGAGSAACVNGGYPNPRNCAICICPGGYGGTLCNQRPAGCGETLVATTAWKTKTFTFGTPNVKTLRDQFMLCNHWVKAPAGKKVQIRVTALKGVACGVGCRSNSIEPKYLPDKKIVNPRICCANMLNQIVTSVLNPAPIVSYNRISTSTFTFQYKYV